MSNPLPWFKASMFCHSQQPAASDIHWCGGGVVWFDPTLMLLFCLITYSGDDPNLPGVSLEELLEPCYSIKIVTKGINSVLIMNLRCVYRSNGSHSMLETSWWTNLFIIINEICIDPLLCELYNIYHAYNTIISEMKSAQRKINYQSHKSKQSPKPY